MESDTEGGRMHVASWLKNLPRKGEAATMATTQVMILVKIVYVLRVHPATMDGLKITL